ncbi:MAG: S8 family serine peptidase, partial [Actinomycetota bacterium]
MELTLPGRAWAVLPGTDAHRRGRVWERRSGLGSSAPSLDRPLIPTPPDSDRQANGDDGRSDRRSALLAIVVAAVVALAAVAAFSTSDGSFDAAVDAPAVDADDLSLGSLYHVVDQVDARDAWALGATGQGVNVAVIDTGVADVAALESQVVARADLSAEAANPDLRFVDTNGHGTHMAGVIAGRDPGAVPAAAVDRPDQFVGVAPDAGIVSVKVAGRDGDTAASDVIAGIDWVIEHADELDIGVINLSYNSGSTLPYTDDPVTAAVERAWNAGIVVVTAAGNAGPDSTSLISPAVDPFVIAVGGAEIDEAGLDVADWASRSDGVRNPDLAAPGAHIQSLRAPGSDADVNHPEGYVDANLFLGSGSSQSAAVVTGVVALMLDANPSLTPDQVKAILVDTASPIPGGTDDRSGAGLVDADAAVAAAVDNAFADATQSFEPATQVGQPIADLVSLDPVWEGVHWEGVHWEGVHWEGVHWEGVHWEGVHWEG